MSRSDQPVHRGEYGVDILLRGLDVQGLPPPWLIPRFRLEISRCLTAMKIVDEVFHYIGHLSKRPYKGNSSCEFVKNHQNNKFEGLEWCGVQGSRSPCRSRGRGQKADTCSRQPDTDTKHTSLSQGIPIPDPGMHVTVP